MSEPARPFFIPMIGIVALFAALGPAVGGAMFIPLSVVFKPSVTPDTIAALVLIAALFGHVVGLVAVYIVGIGPAAATGFLYALWDAAAPARWPRALVAAVIGGLIAYGLASRLAPLGASVEMKVEADLRIAGGRMDRRSVARAGSAVTLVHALVACGAVAGLVCGLAANLLGLTMQPEVRPVRGPASERGRLRWPTPPVRLHRDFLAPPMIRIAALFAALGPAVGWAIFIPLYLVLNPAIAPDAMTRLVLTAALFRHAVGLFEAYVVGIGPAAATALLSTRFGTPRRPRDGRARSSPP